MKSEGSLPGALSGQHKGVRVLIVDDDPSVRALLCDLLEEAGYQVTEAGDGRAALVLLAATTQPAVVLLDQGMPQLTGTEVAAAVARDEQLARRCACMLLTGGADRLAAASDLPLVALIGKPFDLDALLAAVDAAATRLLRHSAFGGPRIAQRDPVMTPHRTSVTSM